VNGQFTAQRELTLCAEGLEDVFPKRARIRWTRWLGTSSPCHLCGFHLVYSISDAWPIWVEEQITRVSGSTPAHSVPRKVPQGLRTVPLVAPSR
jgi:hypothetical protein